MDSAVVIVIVGASSALLGLALRLCYISKCVSVKLCCGLCEINRDTIHEQVISMSDNQQQQPQPQPQQQQT